MLFLFILFGAVLSLTCLLWAVSCIISVFLGAPPISSPTTESWRRFADPNKRFLDLGCGSGKLCLEAAPLYKEVYGIEGSPFYWLVAKYRTRHYPNVKIWFGNFFITPWPEVDIIYCYLLDDVLQRLSSRFVQYGHGTLVCLSFPVPGLKAKERLNDHHRTLYVYDLAHLK